jgi:hypothetical protein
MAEKVELFFLVDNNNRVWIFFAHIAKQHSFHCILSAISQAESNVNCSLLLTVTGTVWHSTFLPITLGVTETKMQLGMASCNSRGLTYNAVLI